MRRKRWLDRVRGDINENGLSGTECRPTTSLHGHVYNSGTKMKKKECVTDGDDVT